MESGFGRVFRRLGMHWLACDCENRHWLVGVDPEGGGLKVLCPICGALSGLLIPQDEVDQYSLKEAAKELKSDSWGNQVENAFPNGTSKKGNGEDLN